MKSIKAEIESLESRIAETGPRGGHIIGKTQSGKPIYDTHDHPAHKDFTSQDHDDAADRHTSILEHIEHQKKKHPEISSLQTGHQKHIKNRSEHRDMAEKARDDEASEHIHRVMSS